MYLFSTDLKAELSQYGDLDAVYEEHKKQQKKESLLILDTK